MKTKIYSLAITLITMTVTGQTSLQIKNHDASKVLAPNEIINLTTEAESNKKVTLDIKNTSSSTKSYNAKRYDVLMNSNATTTAVAYFCIAGSCYGTDTQVSPTPLTLNGGQSASDLPGSFQMLIADLDEATIVGISHVKYTFQNVNDAADSVQISIKYNAVPTNTATTTGLVDLSQDEIMYVGPNPSQGTLHLNLKSSSSKGAQVSILNLAGKKVLESQATLKNGTNFLTFDISTLPSAVYFVEVKSGNIITIRKIIVQ